MLVKFKMVCTQNLYTDFLAKFTLRPPAAPDIRSVNLRAELFALADFLIRKFAHRTFCFNSLSICNLRARFAAARTTLLYTAARLYAFFSLFCMSPYPSSTFSHARPAFKFCRFARSIRSGYERLCAQTPNFRALFTRHCARILSKFYAEFQDCLHLNLRRRHKRSLLRARTKYLHGAGNEI